MADSVVHFEIPAGSVERAQKFYRQAFGWKISPMPGVGYSLVSTTPSGKNGMPTKRGAINGGMLARQDPIRDPVITIQVGSIDTAVKKIARLGGSVVRGKEPVMTMGFAAYFKDSEGNVLGLSQNAPPPRAKPRKRTTRARA
jgi:predicted enzyme related to lactoylglutathione lyase